MRRPLSLACLLIERYQLTRSRVAAVSRIEVRMNHTLGGFPLDAFAFVRAGSGSVFGGELCVGRPAEEEVLE